MRFDSLRTRVSGLIAAAFVSATGMLVAPATASVMEPAVLIRPELPPRALRDGEVFEIPVSVYVHDDVTVT